MKKQRQKALAKKVLQNPSMELGEAMKEVGYSENTRPHDVANTKGWQELMEKYLPDDKVLDVHRKGLEANKVISAKIVGKNANEQTDDFIEVPDHPTRLKAVELAYRVKGRYADKQVTILNQGEMNMGLLIEGFKDDKTT